MKRLTSKRPWDEARNDLENELGYSYIWTRLNEIENIFGDEYDLNKLKNVKDLLDNFNSLEKRKYNNSDNNSDFDNDFDKNYNKANDEIINTIIDSMFDYDFVFEELIRTEIVIDICEFIINSSNYKNNKSKRYFELNSCIGEIASDLIDLDKGYDYDWPEMIKNVFDKLLEHGIEEFSINDDGDILAKIDLLEILMYKRFLNDKLDKLEEWFDLFE